MSLNFCKIHDLSKDSYKMVQFLMEKKLIKSEPPLCGNCSAPCTLDVHAGMWRCRKKVSIQKKKAKECGFKLSINHETWFSNSRMSHGKILKITYGLIKNYRQIDICHEAECDKKTVTNWASYVRQVVFEWSMEKREMIGGPGKIVEIDESKFGKRKFNRGHHVEGQWILGGIERESGKSFLAPVEKRDAATLIRIIKENVLPGTIIYTDCWRSYNTLNDEGFQHFTVNHKLHFVDPATGVHTNTIESLWRHAKDFLPSYSRRKDNYGLYMAHFMFVKKAKCDGKDLFEFFLEEVADLKFNILMPADSATEDLCYEDDYDLSSDEEMEE